MIWKGAIKPNLPQIQRAPEWTECADGAARRGDWPTQYACCRAQPEARLYPAFNTTIYSADVLLPVVTLEMQSYWIPDDQTETCMFARWYLWVQIVSGWGVTLLAVAGFSGLVKQDGR